MSSKKGSPGPEWKKAWTNPKTDDDLYLHEINAEVMIDLEERCKDHPENIFCHVCLPRLNAAGDAARSCLDPEAKAFCHEFDGSEDSPEYIALVNHHPNTERKAYAMMRDGGLKLVFTKPILTTLKENSEFKTPLLLADYLTKSNVCDALYLRSFSVKLKDGISQKDATRLWGTRLSFNVDGEKLITDMPLREALGQKEIAFSRPIPEKSCLFGAHLMDEHQNAYPEKWVGFVLPNGSQILALLDGVRGGSGLVFLETSFTLFRYTTKPKIANA